MYEIRAAMRAGDRIRITAESANREAFWANEYDLTEVLTLQSNVALAISN